MKDGVLSVESDSIPVNTDETSSILSPSVRRQPMTYFIYPGLDPMNLRGFLRENQASSACIHKALDDLGRITPYPSVIDVANSSIRDDMSSISDEVFIEDIIEEPEDQDNDVFFNDTTILDEVPLESEADDTYLPMQTCLVADDKFSRKSVPITACAPPQKKKNKGLSRLLTVMCGCGGFRSRKHKNKAAPTTEL